MSASEVTNMSTVDFNLNVQQEYQNKIASLKCDLKTMQDKLDATGAEVVRVRGEKKAIENQLHEVEKKFQMFREEREKQVTTLNETNRELCAALSERENLMEREEKMRAVVYEAENVLAMCNAADEKDDDSILADTSIVASEGFIIFRAKLKKMKDELREEKRQVTLLKEENSVLQGELNAARESARSLPSLRSKLETSQSASLEKEEKCATLQAQLSKAEQTVQEVKTEILSLQDKLMEEHDTAAKYIAEATSLRQACAKQIELIELLQQSEKKALEKVESVLKMLDQAEKEKGAIVEELQKLEEQKREYSSSLEEQRTANNALRKLVESEKRKARQFLLPGMVVAFVAFVYFSFLSEPSPEPPF